VGFAAMLPFLSTSKYTGFVATELSGADISMFIGLPVAGILYWILAKSVDVEAETKVAQAEAAELERLAHAHHRPEEDTDAVTG
jgi:cytosine/uracil/thiamine/allantoin permease